VQRFRMTPLGALLLVSGLATLRELGIAAHLFVPSPGDAVLGWALLLFMVAWTYDDSLRRTHYWPAYHYGWWLFTAWPFVLGHYLIRTRGRRGWAMLALLYAALLAPALARAVMSAILGVELD
jgi:hypothetical protein